MHRFDVGHQAHGVVGHRGGGAAQDAAGQARLQRLHGPPIGSWGIQRRHVHPWHLGQIPQQSAAAEASGPALGYHQADLGQQLLAIAEGDEIEEGGEGFGIAGGGGAAREDQRWRGRIGQGQVTPA